MIGACPVGCRWEFSHSGGAMLKHVLPCIATIVLLVAPALIHSAPPPSSAIAVHVERDGATFVVEVSLSVAANVDEVWEVLTDFDHMAQILSSVDASRIANREGNHVEVVQKSHGNLGPVRISQDSVRDEELTPKREIRSRQVKGDSKASDFTTSIAEEGGISKITVRGKFVTGGLAASVVTVEAVEAHTRRNYQELREEILRRKTNEPPPPCLLTKTCSQVSG
jgi:carbon monoxide dehydrogenase subunit G